MKPILGFAVVVVVSAIGWTPWAALDARQMPQQTLTVTPFPSSDVLISTVGLGDPFLSALSVLGPGQAARVAAEAALVTNTSGNWIEAIRLRWSIVDGINKPRNGEFYSDSFLTDPGVPILQPRSRMIITPRGFIREPADPGTSRIMTMMAPIVPSSGAGAHLTLTVDALLLDDGRILGPDSFGLQSYMEQRHAATQVVIDQIRLSMASGASAIEAIRKLPAAQRSDPFVSSLVLRLESDRTLLPKLLELRRLPPFRRG